MAEMGNRIVERERSPDSLWRGVDMRKTIADMERAVRFWRPPTM